MSKTISTETLVVIAQLVALCEAYRALVQSNLALCLGYDYDDLQWQAAEEREEYNRRLNRLFQTAPQRLLKPALDRLELELRREDPDRLLGPLMEVRATIALNCPDLR